MRSENMLVLIDQLVKEHSEIFTDLTEEYLVEELVMKKKILEISSAERRHKVVMKKKLLI